MRIRKMAKVAGLGEGLQRPLAAYRHGTRPC